MGGEKIMPLAIVHYLSWVSSSVISDMAKNVLPAAIAKALNIEGCPEAHLTPADIEVWLQEACTDDVQEVDVAIVVDANDYEARRARLKESAEEIKQAVMKTIPGYSGFVWVRLLPAEFSNWNR